MRKVLLAIALMVGYMAAMAQTPIDHFNVGPYVVDYNGKGDVKYRLRNDIDLYEFFDLKMDTTIVAATQIEQPLLSAVQLSARCGANRYAAKEIGIEGVWKRLIGNNLYFGGGLSMAITTTNLGGNSLKNAMFEVGVPLQIELGRMNRQRAALYGQFGITPTFYSTMKASQLGVDYDKKSGLLVAPVLEFGGNIPVGTTIMRLGVYGTYKINCSAGDFNIYKEIAGCAFLGAKIGFVL